ncbi:hypothetical protein ACFE04_012884 [Oxalis oulophora]
MELFSSDFDYFCRHFSLNWNFVNHKTPIRNGEKFCVCANDFLPWLMMPLQIVHVKDSRRSKEGSASFGFSSSTLQGHLLAGEERFSIEIDEKEHAWYQILSFLSFVGYPNVLSRQKYFAHESTNAVWKYLNAL